VLDEKTKSFPPEQQTCSFRNTSLMLFCFDSTIFKCQRTYVYFNKKTASQSGSRSQGQTPGYRLRSFLLVFLLIYT